MSQPISIHVSHRAAARLRLSFHQGVAPIATEHLVDCQRLATWDLIDLSTQRRWIGDGRWVCFWEYFLKPVCKKVPSKGLHKTTIIAPFWWLLVDFVWFLKMNVPWACYGPYRITHKNQTSSNIIKCSCYICTSVSTTNSSSSRHVKPIGSVKQWEPATSSLLNFASPNAEEPRSYACPSPLPQGKTLSPRGCEARKG